MRPGAWTLLDRALLLAVGLAVVLAVVLQSRRLFSSSQVDMAQAAVKDFGEALARYRQRHGHLPGDANRDGEIDAAETAYVARELARAGQIRSGAVDITVNIGGRTVTLRAIARGASAVPNPPPGRNVIELWNLPCQVAQDLDSRTDDGNLAKGKLRASVTRCAIGGSNDPVPVVAVALSP